jgi:putative copper resistance protein D
MDWLTDPLVLARFVHLAACVVAAGTTAFAVLAAEPAAAMADLRRAWRLIVAACAAAAALSGVVWFAIVTANITGTSPFNASAVWSVAADTQFGRLAVARAVLALPLVLPLGSDRVRTVLAFGLIVLIAPAGHAGAQAGPWGWLHLGADAGHLAAAAAWLGGLPALALLLAAAYRHPAGLGASAVRTTARFSWLGMACVGVLIATGAANSWFLLSGPQDLLTTPYGRVLASKLVLFGAMVAIAAVNRFHLTPRLPEPGGLRALQRTTLFELALGLAVLALVALLGTLPPGGHRHDHAATPSDDAFVHIHGEHTMADVTIAPARPGAVAVRLHLSNEDFTDYAARAVHIALRPPEEDAPIIAADAKPMAGATWQTVGITLPRAGIWTIKLTITAQSGAIVVLDGPIVIPPSQQE